jgi:hypothetical protein
VGTVKKQDEERWNRSELIYGRYERNYGEAVTVQIQPRWYGVWKVGGNVLKDPGQDW